MSRPVRIIDLPEVSEIAAGDSLPVAVGGNARRITVSAAAASLVALVPVVDDKETVRKSPSASPYEVSIVPTTVGGSVWFLLSPTGTIAEATFELPAGADRQEVLISTTQELTSLSFTCANTEAGIIGEPTTLAAGGFCRMRYDATTVAWYRAG